LAFLSKQPVGEITKAEATERVEWWIESFGSGFCLNSFQILERAELHPVRARVAPLRHVAS